MLVRVCEMVCYIVRMCIKHSCMWLITWVRERGGWIEECVLARGCEREGHVSEGLIRGGRFRGCGRRCVRGCERYEKMCDV